MTTSSLPAIGVKRPQHIVLQVTDVERSARFYQDVCGFEFHRRKPNGNTFLRLPGSGNDHDLAIFVGAEAPADKKAAGWSNMAFEVNAICDLVRARDRLQAAGALAVTQNHGMSLSIYGQDPDGLEFEFSGAFPVLWPARIATGFEAELAKWGTRRRSLAPTAAIPASSLCSGALHSAHPEPVHEQAQDERARQNSGYPRPRRRCRFSLVLV